MNLDEYIQDEWLDFPVNKINTECGEEFARWMARNQGNAFLLAISSESIQQAQLELSCALLSDDELNILRKSENLMRAIHVEFRDILLDAIGNFHNSFDSEEEEKFESISFDSERML